MSCLAQETNQEVPGWLASLASRGGSYGGNSKRRGGGNRFGGRDFRNDRRGGGGGAFSLLCSNLGFLTLSHLSHRG